MPSSYSSKHSAYLLKLSPSIRYISFINSNGNSLRLICLNFIVLGVHFIGMIRIRINDPGSLRSQHIRRTDESTPGNDKQVRLKCYDSSDLRSLILMQVFPSAPRLINPKNHRFLAGAGGCPGGGDEATSAKANHQKDQIETGSRSVWNTFDGTLKQVFFCKVIALFPPGAFQARELSQTPLQRVST